VAGNVDSGQGELRIPGKVLGNVTSQGKNVNITGQYWAMLIFTVALLS